MHQKSELSYTSHIRPSTKFIFLLLNFVAGAEHLRSVFNRMGLEDNDIVALSGAHTLVTSSTDLQLSLKSSFSTRTYACSFCLVWCCREGHISKFQALMASGQRSPGSSTIRISSKVSFENSLIGTHINAVMFQLYMMAICYD